MTEVQTSQVRPFPPQVPPWVKNNLSRSRPWHEVICRLGDARGHTVVGTDELRKLNALIHTHRPDHNPNVDENQFVQAIRTGNTAALRGFVKTIGPHDLHYYQFGYNEDGRPCLNPLGVAVQCDNATSVKFLLNPQGGDLDPDWAVPNISRRLPRRGDVILSTVSLAVANGSAEALRILLANGADPRGLADERIDPMCRAVFSDDIPQRFQLIKQLSAVVSLNSTVLLDGKRISFKEFLLKALY